MKCEHDLNEREMEAHDGFCPICMKTRISELEKENADLRACVIEARDGYADIIKLVGEAREMIAKQPDDAA